MDRRQVFMAQLDQAAHADEKANAPDSIQEDQAFMNRMKTIPFHRMEEGDLRRLWRIALRGVSVRKAVEKLKISEEIK